MTELFISILGGLLAPVFALGFSKLVRFMTLAKKRGSEARVNDLNSAARSAFEQGRLVRLSQSMSLLFLSVGFAVGLVLVGLGFENLRNGNAVNWALFEAGAIVIYFGCAMSMVTAFEAIYFSRKQERLLNSADAIRSSLEKSS